MWMFIFSILASSSYALATHSDQTLTAQAAGTPLYALVFDKDTKLPVYFREYLLFYKTIHRDEVCFVDKTVTDALKRSQYSAKGTDDYGNKYFKIKPKAAVEVHKQVKQRFCYVIVRRWWDWRSFGGGGGGGSHGS